MDFVKSLRSKFRRRRTSSKSSVQSGKSSSLAGRTSSASEPGSSAQPKSELSSVATVAAKPSAPPATESMKPASMEAALPKTSVVRTALHGFKSVLVIVGSASDAFPPLKSVLGGILAIIDTYEQISGNKEKIIGVIDRLETFELMQLEGEEGGSELRRREKLRKALQRVYSELQRILGQNTIERAANHAQDQQKIAECVEDIRDALTDYQVLLQQDLHRMQYQVANKVDILLLDKLPHAKNASFLSGNRERCLRGTRVQLLQEIDAWSRNANGPQVYWLNGLGGSGKSTISQHFAQSAFAEGRLGASFFCSRDFLDTSNIDLIFPTLARDLAYRYEEFRVALIPIIASNPNVGHESLSLQLEKLIIEPLRSINLRIIILIDALDECRDEAPASVIISLLSRRIEEIPSVKIIITGRPETHIRAAFRIPSLRPHLEIKLLHEVDRSSVDKDIELFLRTRLSDLVSSRSDVDLTLPWPSDTEICVLVRKSGGLFIFASTAYMFIASAFDNPEDRLGLLVGMPESTSHEGPSGVDSLYTRIFEEHSTLYTPQFNGSLQRLRLILGAVIFAFNPLSRESLAKLLGLKLSDVSTSLRPLHSVLLVPDSDKVPIRIFHRSFPDYLMDPERCTNPSFRLDTKDQHAKMTLCCLELMKTKLERNLCKLPRYAMNCDVEDLISRRQEFIGDALEYACMFWAKHLRAGGKPHDQTEALICLLYHFFQQHLLAWLEVLSIMNELRVAVYALDGLKVWLLEAKHPNNPLISLVEESKTFVLHFYDPIEDSALHIYHSALPMVPRSSFICNRYQHELSEEVKVLSGVTDSWDGSIRVVETEYSVTSVVFSNKGDLIAAGGDRVQVFEAATGVCLATLNHDGNVPSVAFSPDDSLIATGSYDNAVRIWEVETGRLSKTLRAHTGTIHSVAFCPDGERLASASSDQSIRVWDISTGTCETILEGHTHTVRSVCWLRDGMEVVSGSWDGTVKVWDTLSAVATKTFTIFDEDHANPIWSVAPSPDSSKIAVGCGDATIQIYDVRTGEKLGALDTNGGTPVVQFSSDGSRVVYASWTQVNVWDISQEINTVSFECRSLTCAAAFSPNGSSVISGSTEGLLKLWRVDTTTAPDQDAGSVQGVEFSPDGKKFVWLVEDQDLHLWDSATAQSLCTFYRIQDRTLSTLTFSSDGLLIAGGYFDGMLCIWDMTDGNLLCTADGHVDQVWALGFSSDGRQLVSGSDGTVMLWKVTKGEGAVEMKLAAVKEFPRQSLVFNRAIFSAGGNNFTLNVFHQPVLNFAIRIFYTPAYQDESIPIPSRTELAVDLEEELPLVDDPVPTFQYPSPDWIVDGNGQRVFWVPPDRRAHKRAEFGRKLVLGTEDGIIVTLDFSNTIVEQLIEF